MTAFFPSLSTDEFQRLGVLEGSIRSPRLRLRASIILLAHAGNSQTQIASLLKTSRFNVRRWTRRFREFRLAGLLTNPGRGPKVLAIELPKRISELLEGAPGDGRELWTQSSIAKCLNVSAATINRTMRGSGMEIPGARTWRNRKTSEVIAGLYLDPPVRVLALFRYLGDGSALPIRDPVVEKLSCQIGLLEKELAEIRLGDGRDATLKRFFEDISRRAGGGGVDLIADSLKKNMTDEAAKFGFRLLSGTGTAGSPLWLSELLKPNYGRTAGSECGELTRQIEHGVLRRLNNGRLLFLLRRPWFLLFKRTTSGAI
jgi:hypothetical protein